MEQVSMSCPIKPFNGEGFNNWSFRMKVFLRQLEVLHCVEKLAEDEDFWNTPATAAADVKAANEAKKKERVKQDNKCRDVLTRAVADSHLEYVKDKEAPKEIWDNLHHTFERKSITNRFMLKRQLLSMRYNESERLQDHFLRFDQLVREIKGAGARMEEEDVICHLMLTMPDSFDAVTTAMETISDRLTMDLVRQKYLDVEAKRRGQRLEADTEEASFVGKSKGKLKCFGCGEFGHKRAQCSKSSEKKNSASKPVKKSGSQNANVGVKTVSFVAAESHREVAAVCKASAVRWFLDSGASDHMSNDKSLFSSMEKLNRPVEILTAKNGVNLRADFKGRVVTSASVDGEKIQITMKDVLYIPDLSLNLLSLRRLENSGKRVVFSAEKLVSRTKMVLWPPEGNWDVCTVWIL